MQVSLTQDQDVIQTFTSHAADQSLTDRVSFRCPKNVDLPVSATGVKHGPYFTGMIVDEGGPGLPTVGGW
jgi:hypothetical protein